MQQTEKLSPWWRQTVILTMVAGFTILIWMAVRSFKDAPPTPDRVVTAAGETVGATAPISVRTSPPNTSTHSSAGGGHGLEIPK